MMDVKKYFSLYIIFFLSITIISSCKKKNFEDHIGPSICPTANFQYVQQPMISNTSFNLLTDTIKFTASFNEEVPWTLFIKGLTSNSFKKFSGYGKSINVKWIGNPDTTVFFLAEQCTVEFKVACIESIVKTFAITKVNTFKKSNYLVFDGDSTNNIPNAFLAAPGGNAPSYGYGKPGFSNTIVVGLNSPEGGNCLCTHGEVYPSPDSATYYFTGYDFSLPTTPLPPAMPTPTSFGQYVLEDPSKVYFNCFVNARGSQTTIPVVVFKEGVVSRSVNIIVYGEGWHYVSFPMTVANVINPKNISTISFTLNGYPNKAISGDFCIDFVSFTNNSAFISSGGTQSGLLIK